MNWYLQVLTQYAVFSGRARRKEYWFFVLFNTLISIGLAILDTALGTLSAQSGIGLLGLIYLLGVFIPSIAVTIRRLHDTDRTGWWLLLVFIPLIGSIILIIFMLLDGTPARNKYGPNPKSSSEINL